MEVTPVPGIQVSRVGLCAAQVAAHLWAAGKAGDLLGHLRRGDPLTIIE